PGISSWRIPDALAPIDRPTPREGCTSYARRGRGNRAPTSSDHWTTFWSADRAAGARSPGVAAGADPAAVDDNGGAVAHAQLAAERDRLEHVSHLPEAAHDLGRETVLVLDHDLAPPVGRHSPGDQEAGLLERLLRP